MTARHNVSHHREMTAFLCRLATQKAISGLSGVCLIGVNPGKGSCFERVGLAGWTACLSVVESEEHFGRCFPVHSTSPSNLGSRIRCCVNEAEQSSPGDFGYPSINAQTQRLVQAYEQHATSTMIRARIERLGYSGD
jgi:hypothetical protein